MNTFLGRIFFGIEIQNIWDPLGTSLKCDYLAIIFLAAGMIGYIKAFCEEGKFNVLSYSGLVSMVNLDFGMLKNWRLFYTLNTAWLPMQKLQWNCLWPLLDMFLGNIVFWSLISDSIVWTHVPNFRNEKIEDICNGNLEISIPKSLMITLTQMIH